MVLSYRLWQERFHGDPDAIGRQVAVNDVTRTVIGIMPERFAYPEGLVQAWLPLALDPAETHPATFDLVGHGEVLGIDMEFIGGDRSVMAITPERGAGTAAVPSAPSAASARTTP